MFQNETLKHFLGSWLLSAKGAPVERPKVRLAILIFLSFVLIDCPQQEERPRGRVVGRKRGSGNSKCLPVDECPQGQCGYHEHWNECGSSCNEDFCCPTMGHGGTTTTDHMGGGTTSATGTAMGVRSLRNAFNINRN